jgi:predicted permease
VSGDFFGVLGIQPALGRLIAPTDDYRGCGAQGAVLSYAFWQREFGGSADVVGRTLTLDGHAFQVMGVTPPSFFGVVVGSRFDVAIPLCSEPLFTPKTSLMERRASWWLSVIGRLKPGWTMERATGQLAAISPIIFAETVPEEFDPQARKQWLDFRLTAVPLATGVSDLRKTYEDPLYLLLALSAVVLLIACANLANLLLARASGRQREMALRLTLGASRARLVRQLLAESLLLAVLGTVAGAILAQFLSRILVALLGTAQRRIFVELTPDWRILVFATALAVITCVLFGLMPAIQASQTEPGVALKSNTRGSTPGKARFRARRLLVIAQVALSLVLVVGAFLFIRSFLNLADLNAGFVQEHVVITKVNWTALHLSADRFPEFQREVLERLRAMGEVSAAAELQIVPMSHGGWDDNIDIPDGPQRTDISFNRVSPGFFNTMQIALLAGRDFADEDTPNSPAVAVVNQEFVRKLFDGANPVGRIFKDSGDPKKIYRIIGIVADTKFYEMRENPVPAAWLSYTQSIGPEPETNVMIRSEQPLLPLIASIKQGVAQTNPALVVEFAPLKTRIRDSLLRERLMAMLSGSFGALATLLAMVGLYGVISYVVAQRRIEIGVRMALGASRRAIVRMVLGEVGVLLGIGLSVGGALTLVFGSAASSMLYGLKAYDPLTLAAATVAIAGVALIASAIPAQRAATVDPMVALREE